MKLAIRHFRGALKELNKSSVSTLDRDAAFEKISGIKLNFKLAPRRSGDVVAIYANNNKAKTSLGWIPALGIDDMMDTAWKWELKLKNDENLFKTKIVGLN